MLSPSKTTPILKHFSELIDPRVERNKKHLLVDVVVICICAILSGVEDFEGIEEYAQNRIKWLKRFLALPNGVPSHDTINRVFRRMNPRVFQECFLAWMAEVATLTDGKVVAIDGKTLCGSIDKASANHRFTW